MLIIISSFTGLLFLSLTSEIKPNLGDYLPAYVNHMQSHPFLKSDLIIELINFMLNPLNFLNSFQVSRSFRIPLPWCQLCCRASIRIHFCRYCLRPYNHSSPVESCDHQVRQQGAQSRLEGALAPRRLGPRGSVSLCPHSPLCITNEPPAIFNRDQGLKIVFGTNWLS